MEIFKCWCCGEKAVKTRILKRDALGFIEVPPNEKTRCYCQKCADELDELEKSEHREYIRLKKREMFKKACDLLEKQDVNMNEYREAIETVEEHLLNNPDKYDSSYEVIATIVLIHNRIKCKRQYKIGKYQVDFLLPELMVVLEIDGERHQHRKSYDSKRDVFIKNALGSGWKIVRIDTKYLDKNAKQLLNAIYAVTDYRDSMIH